jgi:group I intron endonuclease
MNQCGVYVICCEPTGKDYVGASVNVVKRIREHFYRLEKDVHRNRRLQSTYNEYGKDSFSSKVMLFCDPTNLELYGKQTIEKLQPEFNIVHIQHFKRARTRIFKATLKELKKDDEWQAKFFRNLQKQVVRTQKRTPRF